MLETSSYKTTNTHDKDGLIQRKKYNKIKLKLYIIEKYIYFISIDSKKI